MKALRRFWRYLRNLIVKERHVCGCCGSSRIEWKAHVDPNDRLRITWTADDPDDVWCEECATWGGGSVPIKVFEASREVLEKCKCGANLRMCYLLDRGCLHCDSCGAHVLHEGDK